MAHALGRIGLVFLLSVAAPTAFAQQGGSQDDGPLTEEFILISPDWWVPGGDNEGRKDVREVTLPPPPTGPATPVPYCSPGSPICP
jgi:hypothetical protein